MHNMTCEEKTLQLKDLIYNRLGYLSGQKCVLLGLPYYMNIGDILIWEGTCQFLSDIESRCLFTASKETFRWNYIKDSTTILLQGGGNFGDLWPLEQDFRTAIIERYSKNRIVILPQTVYYQDEENLQSDAIKYAKHQDLTICARDNKSYSLLLKYFSANKILLIPDMAFCISMKKWKENVSLTNGKALFLKRGDREIKKFDYKESIKTEKPLDIYDWPTMDNPGMSWKVLFLKKLLFRRRHLGRLVDCYADWIFRPEMLKIGIHFVSSYSEIFTTRLHVAILSTLLGKDYTLFDNSYGKNESFFETWLNDLKSVKYIR